MSETEIMHEIEMIRAQLILIATATRLCRRIDPEILEKFRERERQLRQRLFELEDLVAGKSAT